jgi:hypothetical protein
MQRKFARHYRRMLPALLESVRFRSDNRFQPVIEALAAIQRNLTTHQEHFSEQVPIEGVVTPRWKEKVFEQVNGETKINRRYYELCVLEKLERALKCKEVWVEGSYEFRNPSDDLPSDWSDEQRRTLHYQALGKPLDAQAFVRLLRTRMGAALTNLNRVLPELNHLRIFRPRQNDDRGLWALAKLEPQPEPQSLGLIKEKIGPSLWDARLIKGSPLKNISAKQIAHVLVTSTRGFKQVSRNSSEYRNMIESLLTMTLASRE